MHILSVLFCFFIIHGDVTSVSAVTPDQHKKCEEWANAGQCDANPTFMLDNCATSCDIVEQQKLEDLKQIASIKSFFHLEANDIHGQPIKFDEFEGKVTLVSVCVCVCALLLLCACF